MFRATVARSAGPARLATNGSGVAAAAQRRLQSNAAAKRAVVGIRLEDKNRWERRVPLTPAHVQRLVDNGVRVLVQTSTRRVFPDEEFRRVRLSRAVCVLLGMAHLLYKTCHDGARRRRAPRSLRICETPTWC